MYGVVEIAGHQYKVEAGKVIDVQKLDQEVGQEVSFSDVLFIGGTTPLVGTPTVAGAAVKAKIVKQDRSKKIIMMKRAPGKWRKRRGHRQCFTSLLITAIEDGKGNSAKIDLESKVAQKFLK